MYTKLYLTHQKHLGCEHPQLHVLQWPVGEHSEEIKLRMKGLESKSFDPLLHIYHATARGNGGDEGSQEGQHKHISNPPEASRSQGPTIARCTMAGDEHNT